MKPLRTDRRRSCLAFSLPTLSHRRDNYIWEYALQTTHDRTRNDERPARRLYLRGPIKISSRERCAVGGCVYLRCPIRQPTATLADWPTGQLPPSRQVRKRSRIKGVGRS